MGIRFYRPIDALRGIVARLYVHTSDATADARWLIVPDGDIKLIFPVTGEIRCRIGDRERVHRGGRLILSGMRTLPGQLSFPSAVEAIGVILRPEAAYRLLTVPHVEIRNRTFDGEEIFGSRALRLQQELVDVAGDDNRIALLQSRLAEWLTAETDPVFESAVRWLRQSGGMLQINSLAAQLNYSERQLERKFLMRAGVGPKELASILRFHADYKRIRRSDPGPYAGAVEGYFDQSHFLKAFKRYTGLTPTLYFRVNDYGRIYIPDDVSASTTGL